MALQQTFNIYGYYNGAVPLKSMQQLKNHLTYYFESLHLKTSQNVTKYL